jgi:tetratricopeptide (TPR) repeat protein
MRRLFALLSALLILVASSTARSVADDSVLCRSTKDASDMVIDACTRVIEAGAIQGHRLALVINYRGSGYIKRQEYDRAIADFNESIRLNPGSFVPFLGRAKAYDMRGERDKAEADRRRARQLMSIRPMASSAGSP